MKKIVIVLACILGGITAKAQSQQTVVVYLPATGACYEATGTSATTNGNYLFLSIFNGVPVNPTRERIKVASNCTKGEVRDVRDEFGTYKVECDEDVNVTCFCTGVK